MATAVPNDDVSEHIMSVPELSGMPRLSAASRITVYMVRFVGVPTIDRSTLTDDPENSPDTPPLA